MPALGNRVTTTTQVKLMPKVVDTVLNSNVFATRVLGKAQKWTGAQMKIPIKYQKGVSGGSFSGYDTFSTTASETRVNMVYNPKFYQITVSLPLDELSANATEEKIIDLAALELKSRAQDLADEIGTVMYSDGTGNSSKDPLGLAAIVDDGTSVTTIGSLSRSTYSTLAATKTASGGTLTLAKIATLWSAVTSGSQQPTIGFCPKAVFDLYQSLLQPQERINKDVSMVKGERHGGTGFTGLDYKGVTILPDEKCSTGFLYLLNEDFIDWYALPLFGTQPVQYKSVDIEGNDYSEVLGLGFSSTGWIKPTNQAALINHIFLGGELICDNPKRQGVLTGITGV